MGAPVETCHVGVVRMGEDEPCGKVAIGLIRASEWEREEFGDVPPYPCCVHHARVGRMVPLSELPKVEATR